jgi:hypothetical protein
MAKKALKQKIKNCDLSATIEQSTADKLLNSVKYPFLIIDYHKPFPQTFQIEDSYDTANYFYSTKEIDDLLERAEKFGGLENSNFPDSDEHYIEHQIYDVTSEIIEQAKNCLDAINSGDSRYTGPTKKEVEIILEGGITKLRSYFKGIRVAAHLSFFRLTLPKKPTIILNSPRFDLKNTPIRVEATGELWCYHPFLKCSRWCLKWRYGWKWDRIASITVSPNLVADAYAQAVTENALIKVYAQFNKLRLDYDVLRDIPLEGLVNDKLKNRALYIFDTTKFVATIPIMNSRFQIDKIILPPVNNKIQIDITVKEI